MEALLLYSVFPVAVGAILAWFHRRSFWSLCIRTTLVSLALVGITILILAGPPDHYSPEYLLTGLAYFVVPYLVFVFIPGIVITGLTLLVRRRLRPKDSIETVPVSRTKM